MVDPRESIRRLWSPRTGLRVLAVIPPLALAYFGVGKLSGLDVDPWVTLTLTALLGLTFVVGYSTFFFGQALGASRASHEVHSRWDDLIPFRPSWVWIYGALYYAFVGVPLARSTSLGEGIGYLLGGLGLVLVLQPIYALYPTHCPPAWRSYAARTRSSRLLAYLQSMDTGRSCLPSLHCAMSAYIAAVDPIPIWSIAMPGVVALSCLLVKQHSIKDLPLGLALGAGWGYLARWVFAVSG